jgi:hypothetical protein
VLSCQPGLDINVLIVASLALNGQDMKEHWGTIQQEVMKNVRIVQGRDCNIVQEQVQRANKLHTVACTGAEQPRLFTCHRQNPSA